MKVVEYAYEGSDWGYIELKDGTLVQLPKDAIEELEAEQKQLKRDLEQAWSYKHVIKMDNRNLITEKKRLKKEIAKLKCLALHAMSYAVVSLTSNTNKFKPFRLFVKYNDAYRKAKKELMTK